MKSLRWGACLLVVGCAVAFSGCRSTGKWLSPSELDEYNTLKRLNQEQGGIITGLTTEKELLTNENATLKSTMGDKITIIEAQQRLLDGMKASVSPDVRPDLDMTLTPRGPMMSVKGDVLFSSGTAKLSSSGEKVMAGVVAAVKDKPNKLAICGFTDSDPIKKTSWGSNFNLSGQRALAVLQFLESKGIPPERMHFEAYGQYSLKRDASGKEDKPRSRRAEIILLNENVKASEVPGDAAMPKPAHTTRGTKPKPTDSTAK